MIIINNNNNNFLFPFTCWSVGVFHTTFTEHTQTRPFMRALESVGGAVSNSEQSGNYCD